MTGLLRIITIILAAALALLVVAVVAIYLLVDPRDYQQAISDVVERQTGRTLSIEGDVSLGLLPCCRIAVRDVAVGNPPGFPATPFAQFQRVDLAVQLWPLITRREVVVGGIRLEGPALALMQRADGQGNWSFESAEAMPDTPVAADDAEAAGMPRLSIDSITISEGEITWRDAASAPIEISNIELTTGAVAIDAPVDIDASLNAAGVPIKLSGRGLLSTSELDFSGRLETENFSPRQLLASFDADPGETADPAALNRARIAAKVALTAEALSLDEVSMELDDSRLQGDLRVSQFDRPRIEFDLTLDALNLDRYVSPGADDDREAATTAEPAELPGDELRALNLSGRARVGDLIVGGLRFTDLAATIAAQDGRFEIDPLQASLYGGSARGAVAYDVTGPAPRLSLDQTIEGLDLGNFLGALEAPNELNGLLTGRLSANGAGATQAEMNDSLTGELSFDLTEGVYRGVDLWYEIQRTRARIRNDAPPAVPENPETPITALAMTARIADGTLRSQQMLARIPFLELRGKGALNWTAESVDYRFDARVLEAPELEDGEVLDDLTDLIIPITVTGTVDEPSIGVDLESLTRNVARKKVQDLLLEKLGGDDETEEPAEDESPRDALKRGLRDLLRRQ